MKNEIEVARELRKNSTPAERVLWSRLRAKRLDGLKFRRQAPLAGFIVDFVCLKKKLVVELDGPVHNGEVAEVEREYALANMGLTVIRFPNWRVLLGLNGVLDEIAAIAKGL
jgi:very-short-patch-repair endonuclease